ncbi:hypothetical protein D3C80_2170870 [compost metagenome]
MLVAIGFIVNMILLLAVRHRSIPLIIIYLRERTVNRQLQIIRANPVTLRIGVGE